MITRTAHKEKKYNFDLTIPIDLSVMELRDDDCFGKAWDASNNDCARCADREVCAILYKALVDKRAKDVEKKIGSKFLDEADFDNLTTKKLLSFIKSGETTSKDLLEEGMRLANCDDVMAVKEHIKAWVKENDFVSIKGGIVWLKEEK